MKGIVFTEFLDFVASAHGDDFVDDMMHESGHGESGYTSVGTYEFSELAAILGTYCTKSHVSAPEALQAFGRHLARAFRVKFPVYYSSFSSLIDFLSHIDDHIHVEVRKLYPDAQLPTFTILHKTRSSVGIKYDSCRPLSHLAIGLIEGSAEHYNEKVTVRTTPCPDSPASCLIQVQLMMADCPC